MSLLFVYVVFGPILHILIIYYQDAVCLQCKGTDPGMPQAQF